VRDVIHGFNAHGPAVLQPHWGHGRPRRISDEDVAFVVAVALTRPKRLRLPFTHWSIRKLAAYLSGQYGHDDPDLVPKRIVRIGRERVRVILHENGISFQRTRTWKTSTDPAKDAKLDRIDEVMTRFPDRVFAFDQFGPLSIRPCHGTCWAARKHPDRLRATYPPSARDPVLPRLLRRVPGPAMGCAARAQGRDPHPRRAEDRTSRHGC
jgi:transposase